MRSERQIMDTILSVVKSSDNIRAAYMNGSRANPNVEKDELRDYDIVFSVNDVRRMINGRKCLVDNVKVEVSAETGVGKLEMEVYSI